MGKPKGTKKFYRKQWLENDFNNLYLFISREGQNKKKNKQTEKKKTTERESLRAWRVVRPAHYLWEVHHAVETGPHSWQAHPHMNLFLQKEDLFLQGKQNVWQSLTFLPQVTLLREKHEQLPEIWSAIFNKVPRQQVRIYLPTQTVTVICAQRCKS